MEFRIPQALWYRNQVRALTDGVRRLSDLPDDEARAALLACCRSEAWVEKMLSQRPFKSREEVLEAAERFRGQVEGAAEPLADVMRNVEALLRI